MAKNILIGSSSTESGITEIINEFFYRQDAKIEQRENTKGYNIFLGEKLLTDYIVIKKKNKFRFEEIGA